MLLDPQNYYCGNWPFKNKKAVYRFTATPIKISISFFTEIEKKICPKIYMEHQRTNTAKIILNRKNNAGRKTMSVLKVYAEP